MQVLEEALGEEPARGLLAVVIESPAREMVVIFPVGRQVPLQVVLLLVAWVVAAVVPRAAQIQVMGEAMVEVSAVGLLALVVEAFPAEYPAKEVPTVGQLLLLLVVLSLVAWVMAAAVPRAVTIQVSRRPAPVVPPRNQTQRQLQEQPLELWPQQRQWLP